MRDKTSGSRPARRLRFRCAAGFTLIELLVVISIIILLVAIIMPGVRRAKEYAYSAVCKSNIEQVWSFCQKPASDASLTPPGPLAWLTHVKRNGGNKVVFCPKDDYSGGTVEDLDKLYFVQNGGTFCYLPELLDGTTRDSQIRFTKDSDTQYTITYNAGGYHCAKFIVRLGDPVSIEVPDHLSHEEATGGCGSQHYVSYDADDDGHEDWAGDDFVMKGKGTVNNGKIPGKPQIVYLSVLGSASYAMNAEAPTSAARPSQIFLLDYEKSIADAYGSISEVDDFDMYLEPSTHRHLGKVNVARVDGAVASMTQEQLEWERDRPEGEWRR